MNRSPRTVVCFLSIALLWAGSAGAATRRRTNNRAITARFEVSEPAGWELVRLLGTRVGHAWDEPVMLVDVQSVRGGRAVTLVVHNSGWRRQQGDVYRRQKRATKPEVPRAISGVLKKHKRGDVIAICACTVNGLPALHGAKAYQAKPGEFAPDSAYFLKSEQRQSGSRTTTRVTLVKNGKKSVVPLMQIRGKDDKGRTTYTTREDLVEAVGKLTEGDLVEVDVGTDRGTRVVRYIAPWEEPFVGQFVELGQEETDGVKHVTVQIRSVLGPGPLMVQQVGSSGGKTRDDYRMAKYVKSLKKDQYVAFKVRTQDDKRILWLISRTDKTTSKRSIHGAKPAPKGGKKKKKGK